MNRRRAFLSAEAMVTVVGLTTLLIVMSMAIAQHRRGDRDLAEMRRALRACEEAAALLDAGSDVPDDVAIAPLPDTAPEGKRWVRITATSPRQHNATLVALVPANASVGGKQP